MRTHQQPPADQSLDDLTVAGDTTLDAIAAGIARSAHAAVAAADHHRGGDRDGDGLAAVAVILAAVDRLTAAVIGVLQSADHARVIAEHGLTRDTWLRAVAGRTGGDAGMLLAAAERLVDMPAVTAWFHRGVLSWGAVRAIVASTRNLTGAQRAWVDQALADHADDVQRLDGDQVAAAVDGLAARARPDLHRDRDANALRRRWLSLQPRLDGTADIAGSLDPETAASALAAFDNMRTPDPDNADPDGGDDEGMSDGDRVRASRRQTNVDVFGDLCRQRLTRHHHAASGDPHVETADSAVDAAADEDAGAAGSDDRAAGATGGHRHGDQAAAAYGGSCPQCGSAPSTARPAFLVVADLAVLDPDAPVGSGTARLHWATDRAPIELTPAAARRLACDATLRAVITDGAQVLGVTAAHPKVSATLRAALIVRDSGCRFPTCTQPAERCDSHHVVGVADHGPTCLSNLALICRDHHHAIHDCGWHVTLHADATMTFTRRNVTLTSQPRTRQHPTPTQPPPAGRPRRHHTEQRGQPPAPECRPGDADPGQPAGNNGALDPPRELLPF